MLNLFPTQILNANLSSDINKGLQLIVMDDSTQIITSWELSICVSYEVCADPRESYARDVNVLLESFSTLQGSGVRELMVPAAVPGDHSCTTGLYSGGEEEGENNMWRK